MRITCIIAMSHRDIIKNVPSIAIDLIVHVASYMKHLSILSSRVSSENFESVFFQGKFRERLLCSTKF